MRLLLMGITLVLLSACRTQEPQHPTLDEYLALYIDTQITDLTDIWQYRIGVDVVISADNNILVTMTASNGESPMSEDAMKEYETSARNIIEGILLEYRLTGRYKVEVQFI